MSRHRRDQKLLVTALTTPEFCNVSMVRTCNRCGSRYGSQATPPCNRRYWSARGAHHDAVQSVERVHGGELRDDQLPLGPLRRGGEGARRDNVVSIS